MKHLVCLYISYIVGRLLESIMVKLAFYFRLRSLCISNVEEHIEDMPIRFHRPCQEVDIRVCLYNRVNRNLYGLT